MLGKANELVAEQRVGSVGELTALRMGATVIDEALPLLVAHGWWRRQVAPAFEVGGCKGVDDTGQNLDRLTRGRRIILPRDRV
jgi:hypothetical protein